MTRIEPARPGFVAILAAGGKARAVVAAAVADRFAGFVRDLETSGYRIKAMGGYARRIIDPRFTGGRRILSQHARGRAIDVDQERRNVTSQPMDRRLVSKLARANGLCSGGDWSRPDLGHFEVCGRAPTRIAGERTVASVFNDARTACPPYRLNPRRMEVAHPTLPCGTKVEVENLENGRKVKAVVADVGPCTQPKCLAETPHVAERRLDLAKHTTAKALRSNGLTPVVYSEIR